MIIRIVKMTFKETLTADFEALFNLNKAKIRNFPGVEKLELLRDKTNPSIFFTYSIWSDEAQLEQYRNSELFKTVWSKTKLLFDSKPEAWTVNKEISL